jgi:pyruvate/2-oxoglutarate dehydrogenase complex dihydrolipoamide acyltransferase (E2) component
LHPRHRWGIDDRIETRVYLSMTVSIDHDIIDGAPAARFAQRFTELIESGCGHLANTS